jgi:hypothetical protein
VVDDATDPAAATVEAREAAELVVAGSPEGCSGKANAVAAGLKRASDDVIVLTDDDVPREEHWLDRIKRGVSEHDAVTGMPLFTHTGGRGRILGWVMEPAQGILSIALLLGDGFWGGAAGFRRADIDDMDALRADLRRTVTDDLLIGEHITTDRKADVGLAATIPVHSSTIGAYLDRVVRNSLTFRYADEASLWVIFGLGLLQAALLLLGTLPAVVLMWIGGLLVYDAFDARRWTVVFTPVSLVILAGFAAWGATREEFEWGGRRYRWRDKFDVEVVRS